MTTSGTLVVRLPAQSCEWLEHRSTRLLGPKRRPAFFPQNTVTNSSGRLSNTFRRPDGPSSRVPSGSTPDESTAVPASAVRHRPMASKFSSANPKGSIAAWQLAQPGFLRCFSMSWRNGSGLPSVPLSSKLGTLGGGGGGGAPSMFSSSHLPRKTTDVRLAYEVTVRRLP